MRQDPLEITYKLRIRQIFVIVLISLSFAFYLLPKKLVIISKRIIRSVFYRTFSPWKISPSVDKLYFLYDDQSSEPDHKLVSFYFDGDLKVLDK